MPIHAHDPRSFQINGAAMEVHRILRRGLLEQLYCEALAIEFELRNIPFVAQVPCQARYKDRPLSGFYKIDFICFENIVVEVKAVSTLARRRSADPELPRSDQTSARTVTELRVPVAGAPSLCPRSVMNLC
jgi:GxxExxY protein